MNANNLARSGGVRFNQPGFKLATVAMLGALGPLGALVRADGIREYDNDGDLSKKLQSQFDGLRCAYGALSHCRNSGGMCDQLQDRVDSMQDSLAATARRHIEKMAKRQDLERQLLRATRRATAHRTRRFDRQPPTSGRR